MKLAAMVFCLSAGTTCHAAQLVMACQVGSRPSHRLAIIRDTKVADTHIYYLEQSGKRRPLFGTADQSRGSAVIATCAGRKTKALIISGEFTANALQGCVIGYRPDSNTLERMDFAEKSRPQWLYLGRHDIIAVIPTSGYGETNAQYVAYRHIFGRGGEDQVNAINRLPPSHGYDVINLTR